MRLTFHIQHYLGLYSHCKFNLKIQKRDVSNYFQNGWQVTQKKVKDQRGLNCMMKKFKLVTVRNPSQRII